MKLDTKIKVSDLKFGNIATDANAVFSIQSEPASVVQHSYLALKEFDSTLRSYFSFHFFPNFPSLCLINSSSKESIEAQKILIELYFKKIVQYTDVIQTDFFQELISKNETSRSNFFSSIFGTVKSVGGKATSKVKNILVAYTQGLQIDHGRLQAVDSLKPLFELQKKINLKFKATREIIERFEEVLWSLKLGEEAYFPSKPPGQAKDDKIEAFLLRQQTLVKRQLMFSSEIQRSYLLLFQDIAEDLQSAKEIILSRFELRQRFMTNPKQSAISELGKELETGDVIVRKELEQFLENVDENHKQLLEAFFKEYDLFFQPDER